MYLKNSNYPGMGWAGLSWTGMGWAVSPDTG